jgi:hypothetical protein
LALIKPAKNKSARPKTIAAYIKAVPKDSRQKLRKMLARIRKLAPGSTETSSTGCPRFAISGFW